jgi:hypothetical protein
MALGTIIRPTEGFRTEIVKTKTSENQVAGDLLVWNLTNKNYEKPATNATNPRCAIVVNTQTNVGNDASNTNIDGIREVLERDWEIVVKCTSGCNVGDELKYSATVAGTVDKWVPGTDTDSNKIVGRCVKLESQEHYDVTATLTSPGAASNIIMYKYPRRPTAVDLDVS